MDGWIVRYRRTPASRERQIKAARTRRPFMSPEYAEHVATQLRRAIPGCVAIVERVSDDRTA